MSEKIEEATSPYYAEGNVVWKRHVEKKNEDGSRSISIGFPVCTMHEACADQAETVAKMLCRSDAHEGLVKALRDLLDVVEADHRVKRGDYAASRKQARAALKQSEGTQ